MASPYFTGRPLNPLQSPAAAELTEAAHKVVKVRAHTRKIQPKRTRAKVETPAAAPQVNTATVRPTQVSTEKRYVPHYPKEPPAGYVSGALGGTVAPRPYYTDKYTTHHGAGPVGQASTRLNAAQVEQAKRIQAANYGKPGLILRSLLPGGADEGGINTANAVSRVASVATTALPGGGVGEAAGILGLGLKGLKGLRAGKGAAQVAPKAAHAFEATPGAGTPEWTSFFGKDAPGISRVAHPNGDHFVHRDASGNPNGVLTIYNDEAGKPTRMAVVVRPDARRQGIATALYGAAKDAGVNVRAVMGKESLTPEGAAFLNSLAATPKAAHTTEAAAVIRGALPGAKVVRGKQEAGYTPARAERVAAGQVHLDNPNLSPDEAFARAQAELRGPLPKINFLGFGDLSEQTLHEAQTQIREHPHLQFFQKINARNALVNALGGTVPTRSEILLLEHVFGKETTGSLAELAKHPGKEALLNALNIPRSLMASFDLSAPFRQGLVVATRHPAIFAKNFGPMIKAFGSEKVYHGMIDEIRARPTYPLMVEAKLPITELGDIGRREEQFKSSYAETLTGGKYSPVRASGRAFTGFLDKTRADVFDHLIAKAQSQGENVQDPKLLQSIGTYIGSATGRGQLRHFEQSAEALNAIFFSPRLMASRFNFINPAYYKRLDPFARKEALRSAVQLAGTASTLVALASQVPGVKVATDPRNPDWGKIKIGNTRIDIGGGFQQELRFLAQIASGVAISSTTGKSLSLTTGDFGKPTRLDIAERFFMGKESPVASLVTDYMRGSTQIGEKFSWDKAAAQRLTPLLSQSSLELYKEQHGGMNGLAAAFAGYGVGSLGFGVQTYGPGKPKVKPSSSGNPYSPAQSGGGGSPYSPSPSGAGGSPYAPLGSP